LTIGAPGLRRADLVSSADRQVIGEEVEPLALHRSRRSKLVGT
jgi:hypothetical protein